MTLPLPWAVVQDQTGELADTQAAYRMLMPAAEQARVGALAIDTFTRPDSATLDNTETGQAWELLTGAFAVASLKASSSTTSTAVLNVGRADVDVFGVIVPGSGTPGLVLRSSADGADRLSVQLDIDADMFRLQKTVSGTTTPVSSAAATLNAGTAYAVRAVAIGTLVRCYLDGAQLVEYTLTSPEQTLYGALPRVGLRNAGAATFDDFLVRYAYPTGGTAVTLASLPAGSTITVVESGGAYVRPTARADIIVRFQGSTNPGSVALENDEWVRLP